MAQPSPSGPEPRRPTTMNAPVYRSCHAHHDAEMVITCSQCGFPLCDACWTHTRKGAPWCVTCTTEATRSFRRWSWAVTDSLRDPAGGLWAPSLVAAVTPTVNRWGALVAA